jgi:hypothetical protein
VLAVGDGHVGLQGSSLDQINQAGCEIVVENDFLYGSPAKPIQVQAAQAPGGILYDYSTPADIYKGWKVAVSREFFHTVEFGYDYAYQYAYHNMCAVWFQLRAYPGIYDHWKYLPAFISDKFGGAFAAGGSIPYGNYVFVRGSLRTSLGTRRSARPGNSGRGACTSIRDPALFVPTRRVDILGRSLNPDAQGLVIESDGVKTVPAIQLK